VSGAATTALVVGVLAGVVALARWLRVSQREHYLPGACTATARLWVRVRPPNAIVLVAGAAGAVVALAAGATTLGSAAAIVAAVAGAAFPVPMTVLGREVHLRLTRRAVVLGAIALLGAVVLCAVAIPFGRGAVAPGVVAIAMAVVVDLAAAVAAPIERRLLERHRRRAAAKLAAIAPTVIAVTGSWGKTSTKNHIRDLLAGAVATVASPASFNNTAGISITINEHMGPDCRVLVAELGTFGPGEIRALCAWLRPEVAVITAIGPMHLERMGTLDAIAAAKAEITETARDVVLWVDDPRLADLAERLPGKRVWRVGTAAPDGAPFATTRPLDVSVLTVDGTTTVFQGEARVGAYAASPGVHAGNVGCAVAAALAIGIDVRLLADPLARLSTTDHRGTLGRSDRGVWVIDDTFNSNPAGASAALAELRRAGAGGRRAVVTPGMVELGSMQDDANRSFAHEARDAEATLVIVGWTNRRALRAGAGDDAHVVEVRDRAAAREWVRATLADGDAVLWENDLPDHYP